MKGIIPVTISKKLTLVLKNRTFRAPILMKFAIRQGS